MSRIKSNYQAILSLAIALTMVLSLPYSAFAQSPAQSRVADEVFCQTINQINDTATAQVQLSLKKVNAQTSSDSFAAAQQKLVTQKLSQTRKGWDNKRNDFYQKMIDKANNDQQKQAIKGFANTVNNVVSERRQNIDAATNQYFEKAQEIQHNQQQAIKDASSSFDADIRQSFSTAASSCNAGTDVSSIRSNLSSNIVSARVRLFGAQKVIAQNLAQIQQLRKTEETSIESSLQSYNQDINTALRQLKIDLQNSGADPSQLSNITHLAS